MDPEKAGFKLKQTTYASSTVSKAAILFIVACIAVATSPFLKFNIRPYPNTVVRPHCESIFPISQDEYQVRQATLAHTLHASNASAYIAEPGASTQYFANFSTSDWKLSERPLLLIITPITSLSTTDIQAQVAILTPKFESTRARGLPVPQSSSFKVKYIEWAEEANPYVVALSALSITGTIYVDDSIRTFIVDGLQNASTGPHSVQSAPSEIRRLRERKSKAETEILKCANEATLLAIREVHKSLHVGIRESQARDMMAASLSAAGLKSGGCLTLFGENAALPHGSGTDRTLSENEFALFDCTASLHGYFSDVTRTIALPSSNIPDEYLEIWYHVHTAQKVAVRAAKAGVVAHEVDDAARTYLSAVGYGRFFTHRLGHGIGLEVHEQPFLHGGSNDVIATGHTFSNEPGVYIEHKLGVRLEDCFFIDADGNPKYLTEGVGGQSTSPWLP